MPKYLIKHPILDVHEYLLVLDVAFCYLRVHSEFIHNLRHFFDERNDFLNYPQYSKERLYEG